MEASAVRKAVSSSALTNAYGIPLGLINVSDPLGVVDWEEETADAGNKVDVAVRVDAVDADELLLVLARLRFASEGGWEEVVLVGVDVPLPDDAILSCRGSAGAPREIIFMPLLVLVLAGINSVVELSGPGIAIRCG